MFESLSDRLSSAFRSLSGRAQLTEENIRDGLREVRLALLEADVNFKVVKEFVERVRERVLGQEVEKSLTPTQQLVKAVHDELVTLLGGETTELNLRGAQPGVIMMVGLQGSGKTTSAGKLANLLRKQKMRPYLVPVDVYRPAAIDQLRTLARQLDIPCFASSSDMKPVDIVRAALEDAKEKQCTVVILDTAGRLHIDAPLMQELVDIKSAVQPQEILFVADAMTGQDAVTVAEAFNKDLALTGVVLTKMDGDARGGAALSIKSVTGAPGGAPTQDRVFALSEQESVVYLSGSVNRSDIGAAPASQAAASGPLAVSEDGTADWWLRSPGTYAFAAQYVDTAGTPLPSGANVDVLYGVRPALWIDIAEVGGGQQ